MPLTTFSPFHSHFCVWFLLQVVYPETQAAEVSRPSFGSRAQAQGGPHPTSSPPPTADNTRGVSVFIPSSSSDALLHNIMHAFGP